MRTISRSTIVTLTIALGCISASTARAAFQRKHHVMSDRAALTLGFAREYKPHYPNSVGQPEHHLDRRDRLAHEAYERYRVDPRGETIRLRAISETNTKAKFWHRQGQIDRMVAEQGQRQRNGALPIGGAYGFASSRKSTPPRAKPTTSAAPAQRSSSNDGGPDLVQRWITDVDRRWDAKMKIRAK